MSRNFRILLGIALLMGIAVLTAIGLRRAPMEQAANSAESRQTCEVESPEAFRAIAQEWCANGLFAKIEITEEPENIVVLATFNPNGGHVWQLQNSNLLGSFRNQTEKIAARANGRSVGVSVHDASDNRIASCARLSTDPAARCEAK